MVRASRFGTASFSGLRFPLLSARASYSSTFKSSLLINLLKPVAYLRCHARCDQRKPSSSEAMVHTARAVMVGIWLLAGFPQSAGSEVGAALTVGFCLLCAVCCHQGCALISQGNGALVERFGCLDRQLGPGFHLKLPFVERISAHLSTRERILDVSFVRASSLGAMCNTGPGSTMHYIRQRTADGGCGYLLSH